MLQLVWTQDCERDLWRQKSRNKQEYSLYLKSVACACFNYLKRTFKLEVAKKQRTIVLPVKTLFWLLFTPTKSLHRYKTEKESQGHLKKNPLKTWLQSPFTAKISLWVTFAGVLPKNALCKYCLYVAQRTDKTKINVEVW